MHFWLYIYLSEQIPQEDIENEGFMVGHGPFMTVDNKEWYRTDRFVICDGGFVTRQAGEIYDNRKRGKGVAQDDE